MTIIFQTIDFYESSFRLSIFMTVIFQTTDIYDNHGQSVDLYTEFGPYRLANTDSTYRGSSTLLVVQLLEALRYKPEGRGFGSR